MALSKDEREQFLAEPHIAAMSVYAGDARGPLTVPIWYQYAPGGEPWILTGSGSRKHRLIEAAGHLSLMVERLEPSVRYVAVDGAVSRIEPGTDPRLAQIVAALRTLRGAWSTPSTRAELWGLDRLVAVRHGVPAVVSRLEEIYAEATGR